MTNHYTVLADNPHIEKPLLDDRLYRLVKLKENDLTVLLISDPTADKSAASLDVGVGSFADKQYGISGLAHFCEHLLFMGTKKYPKENEYSNYLAKHSGHSNAYTAAEHTNYYFQVGSDYLEGALDRFAQFFISPLFSKTCQDREINAVDSENKKNLQNDTWRLFQLDKATSNPLHPYNGFSTGNFETLHEDPLASGLDVRDVLIKFYTQHYSANLMSLVILGKEDLDTLSEWAIEKFSAIPNKDYPRANYNGELIYKPGQLKKLIKAAPIKDDHKLELSFMVPDDMEAHWASKPHRYFSHLLGHESKGSLAYYLKQQGWSTDLSAGGMKVCQGCSLFYIEVQLTPQGLENWEEITKSTLEYVKFVTEDEPQSWIWKEIEEMTHINFKFKQKSEASSTVSGLSSKLFKFDGLIPPQHLLSDGVLRQFDPQLIREYGQYLVPDNLRVTLVSQSLTGLNKVEKWYKTKYAVEDILSDLVSPVGILHDFHYPEENAFIPSDFTVLSLGTAVVAPYVISASNKMNVWFKQDQTFKVPKGSINIALHLPSSNSDVLTSVLTSLSIELFNEEINDVNYYALMVGMRATLQTWRDGFVIKVSGYNDKLDTLLQHVLSELFAFKPSASSFESIKYKLLNSWKNFLFRDPYLQIGLHMVHLMNEKLYDQEDKIKTLEGVTFEQLQNHFHETIWKQGVFAEVLVHGNFDIAKARSIKNTISNSMKHVKPWMEEYDEKFHLEGYVLEPKETVRYEIQLKDEQNINSCVEYFIQIAPNADDLKLRVLTDLLCTIIKEPCFDQLRTKEQLGYVVFSGIHLGRTSLGFRILVQSERTCDYLQYRIEEFLRSFGNFVNHELTTEDFIKFKHALKNIKLTKLKHLSEETGRLWSSIVDGYYDFEGRTKQVEVLENVTKSEFIDFFNLYISKDDKTAKLITFLRSQNPIEFTEPKRLQAAIINYLYHNGVKVDHEFIQELVKSYQEDKNLSRVLDQLHTEIKTGDKEELFREVSKRLDAPVPDIYPTGELVVTHEQFRSNHKLGGKPRPVSPLTKFLYNDQSHL
ncbi:A-factor-processing enzyme [Candida viswanathii]|uniref:A-factor-processing enzyme n=1 Tax=Candida viswanathii TaxID=5486 RepID=A0A367YPZ9_9ASCO|nr:A-factor-processing enzyme [Candida viswanathii]